MRIVLVTPEFAHTKDGGLANYTYRIASYLKQYGHGVIVIIPEAQNRKFVYKGIEVHEVGFRDQQEVRGLKNFFSRRGFSLYEHFDKRAKAVMKYLSALNSQYPINVVHYAHLGGLGKYRLENIPSVVRLSSSTRLCHEQGGYGESYKEMLDQETIELEAIRKADKVFGPSGFIAKYVAHQAGRDISVIETPFEFSGLKDKSTSIYERTVNSRKFGMYFGSLVKLKGVEVLAAILTTFLEQNPDYDFVFIGKSMNRVTGEPMEKYIKQRVQDQTRIKFTGKLSQEELVPFLENADFVALPSLIDNFPNTCIEAMYHYGVVIGTKKNGFEQLIDNGVSGFLVEPGNTEDLIQCMNNVARMTDAEKREIGRAARERIDRLNPKSIVAELISLYEEAIFQCAE